MALAAVALRLRPGFIRQALVADSYDEALRYARAHVGPNPRIIANLPPLNAVPWVERRDEANTSMLHEAAHSP